MIDFLLSGDALMALLTLTFLEIILGIDNILFISISAGKLPQEQRKKATNIGLLLALVQRVILLFFVSYLTKLKTPFWVVESSWISFELNVQSLILMLGGLFLLYKSTTEIMEKLETNKEEKLKESKPKTLKDVLLQILIIDLVFSIDSILTAVGMTSGLHSNSNYTLILMITAVIISIIVMIAFANKIREVIERHPSMQILGLAFLILIAFLLITESAHVSHAVVFNNEVGVIPKGYLYFAIAFSLGVEIINIRMKKSNLKKKSNTKVEE
ncbi:TerC family protein [Brumimicrobium aurantiacum]|uniref:TerC family protein n=1 Tax=Brumimicrobium aurantiacum TaxID=1737063 RepID=A0A3E1F0Z7_9FLAO|nr:TerC family protein [Brumimicrobium aurantiacum]RFC55480.1 TerC family protein [Brumimicrobium aurantiacum]